MPSRLRPFASFPLPKPFAFRPNATMPFANPRPHLSQFKKDDDPNGDAQTPVLPQAIKGIVRGMAEEVLDVTEGLDEALGYYWHEPLWAEQGVGKEEGIAQLREERQLKRNEIRGESSGVVDDIAKPVAQFMTYALPVGWAANAGRLGATMAQQLAKMGMGEKSARVGGIIAEGELAALTAENLAFAPDEARLSNLIESVPALANPVTEFLSANPDDPKALQHLKQNLEGLGLGIMASPLTMMFAKFKVKGAEDRAARIPDMEGELLAGKPAQKQLGGKQPVTLEGETVQAALPEPEKKMPPPGIVDKIKSLYKDYPEGRELLAKSKLREVVKPDVVKELEDRVYHHGSFNPFGVEMLHDTELFMPGVTWLSSTKKVSEEMSGVAQGGKLFESKVKLGNPLVIDAKGAHWSNIKLADNVVDSPLKPGAAQEFIHNELDLEVEGHGMTWFVQEPDLDYGYVVGTKKEADMAMAKGFHVEEEQTAKDLVWSTDDVVMAVRESEAFDSVVFRNVNEGGPVPVADTVAILGHHQILNDTLRVERTAQHNMEGGIGRVPSSKVTIKESKEAALARIEDRFRSFENPTDLQRKLYESQKERFEEHARKGQLFNPAGLQRVGENVYKDAAGGVIVKDGKDFVMYSKGRYRAFESLKDARAAYNQELNLEVARVRNREIFQDLERAERSVLGDRVERLEKEVLDGFLTPDEALQNLEFGFQQIDPKGDIIPEVVRTGLRKRVQEPSAVMKRPRHTEGKMARHLFEESERKLEEQHKLVGKRMLAQAGQLLVDHAGTVKNKLLREAGDEGKVAVMKFELAAGAPAKADFAFKKYQASVYAPLEPGVQGRLSGKMKKDDRRSLDQIIQFMRGHEIARTNPKAAPRVGKKQMSAAAYLDELEAMKLDLGPEKYGALVGRAHKYFDAMKDQLADLHEAGLISKKEFLLMKSMDYQPRQMLEAIDPVEEIQFGRKRVSVASSGVKALGKGSTDLIVNDSEFLLAQVISRVQARIAKNEASKALADVTTPKVREPELVARIQDAMDGIASRIESGDYDVGDTPEGLAIDLEALEQWLKKLQVPAMNPLDGFVWKRKPKGVDVTTLSYMEKGKRKKFYMETEMAKLWADQGQVIGPAWSKWMGTDLVRTMATGINPEFALVNFPRDMLYIFMTTNEYSPAFPKAIAQMAIDGASVVKDAMKKEGRYEDYIKEGGGMSFLTHGARLHTQDEMKGQWDRVKSVLGYVNETSEVFTRLMLRERAMKNGASPEEATWAARKYIDFSQGGSGTKQMDAFIPYLNASVQGMRGFVKAVRDRPAQAATKLSQLGVATGALYLYNELNHPEVMSQISPEEKSRYWVIPTGTMRVDNHGNQRHQYMRIPIEHSVIPFKAGFDALMEKGLKGTTPKAEVIAGLQSALSIVGEQGALLPPGLKAMAQYWSNYDFYTNDKIWKGKDVLPTQERRQFPNSPTSQMAMDVADVAQRTTGIQLSPERLERSVGAILPRNIWTTAASAGYEKLRNTPQYQQQMHNATEGLMTSAPGMRRLFSETHPLATAGTIMEELTRESNSREEPYNREVYALATLAVNNGRFKTSGPEYDQLKDLLQSAPPIDRERLLNRYVRIVFSRKAAAGMADAAYGEARNPVWWLGLSGMPPDVRAQVAYQAWRGVEPGKRRQFLKAMGAMPAARNREFAMEFKRLQKENGNAYP